MGKKVLVIGSGVGGLAAAALLAKRDIDVTVFEEHSFIGGRCSAYEKDGFKFDFGVHMFSRGDAGPHGEVARRVLADLKWIKKDPSCRVMGAIEFDFPLKINSLSRQIYLARKLKVNPARYIGAFLLFLTLMRSQKVKQNDHLLLKEFVSRFTRDPSIHLFINCVCQLYFAISYQEASAGEFMWCFSRMFKDASFGYPKGGCGRIPEALCKAMENAGEHLKLNEPVKKIVEKDARAVGVEAQSGYYPADIIISNTGLERTMALAGQEAFEQKNPQTANTYVYSNPYLTIKYALNYPVIPYPVVFHMPKIQAEYVFDYVEKETIPEDPYIFMPIPSNLDPSLAPPGKQLVIAGTAAPKNADKDLCNAILDKVHQKICQLFPELPKAMLWEMRTTRSDVSNLTHHLKGEAIGLAQTPDQVGTKRPQHATPIQNLYLLGADVGARGIGTEMASASALTLVDAVEI